MLLSSVPRELVGPEVWVEKSVAVVPITGEHSACQVVKWAAMQEVLCCFCLHGQMELFPICRFLVVLLLVIWDKRPWEHKTVVLVVHQKGVLGYQKVVAD